MKPTRSVSYAALSYTWGGSHNQFRLTQRNVQFLEEIGSLGDITEVVAKVVMDAITVCARLQIPYLWVDSLCIVQDDDDGKHYQISNMNHIYANAYMTIVAANEEQACSGDGLLQDTTQTGLPKVSSEATMLQKTLKMGGIRFTILSEDACVALDRNLAQSPWFSRGWYVAQCTKYVMNMTKMAYW